ncbi:MAG: hypothetical protein WCA81_17540 [Rhizomicrobium sp.]
MGTHRMLAVVAATGYYDENTIAVPANVQKALNGLDTDIFANYAVCPLTRSKPGHMQHVCIVSASHLVIVKPH